MQYAKGYWKARAVSMTTDDESAKGTPCAKVMFVILEGPDKDKHVTWNGWLSDKAQQFTVAGLKACGFDGQNETTVTRNEVVLAMKDKPYEKDGKTIMTTEIRVVDPKRAGVQLVPMDSAKKASVKDNLRALMLKEYENSGTTFDHGANKTQATQVPQEPKRAVKF